MIVHRPEYDPCPLHSHLDWPEDRNLFWVRSHLYSFMRHRFLVTCHDTSMRNLWLVWDPYPFTRYPRVSPVGFYETFPFYYELWPLIYSILPSSHYFSQGKSFDLLHPPLELYQFLSVYTSTNTTLVLTHSKSQKSSNCFIR